MARGMELATKRRLSSCDGSDELLAIETVSVNFGSFRALNNVSLHLARHARVGLIGPNGAGKSTLINMAAGQLTPTSGRVRFRGRDVTSWGAYRRARLGLSRTFQGQELFEHMSIRENVIAVLTREITGPMTLRRAGKKVDELLEQLGLLSLSEIRVSEVSHGTRALTGLARALVTTPSILMLDEASAGLGISEKAAIRDAVLTFVEANGAAILVVEHDLGFVKELCNQVLVLDDGEMIAQGSIDDVLANTRVQQAYLGAKGLSN